MAGAKVIQTGSPWVFEIKFSIQISKGEGIGKSNQGIVAPIKASFKFNNAGVISYWLYIPKIKKFWLYNIGKGGL